MFRMVRRACNVLKIQFHRAQLFTFHHSLPSQARMDLERNLLDEYQLFSVILGTFLARLRLIKITFP